MGLCGSRRVGAYTSSSVHHKPDTTNPKEQFKELFETMHIRPDDGEMLYQKFNNQRKKARLGALPPKYINMDCFFDALNIEQTKTTERMFLMFESYREGYGRLLQNPELDETGMAEPGRSMWIDFSRWAVFVWNYCSFDRNGISMFLFTLYDEDSKGTLPMPVVETMVRELFRDTDGNGGRTNKMIRTIHDTNIVKKMGDDPNISKDELLQIVRLVPGIMEPMYTLQFQLRKQTGGASFWNKMAMARNEMTSRLSVEDWTTMMKDLGLDVYRDRKRQDALQLAGTMNAAEQYFKDKRASLPDATELRKMNKAEKKAEKEAAKFAAIEAGEIDDMRDTHKKNKKLMEYRREQRMADKRRFSAANADTVVKLEKSMEEQERDAIAEARKARKKARKKEKRRKRNSATM